MFLPPLSGICDRVICFLYLNKSGSKYNHLIVRPRVGQASADKLLSVFVKRFAACGVLMLAVRVQAQDSITVDYLLDRIETHQLKNEQYFIDGIFPSYISAGKKFKTKRKDNTIFYNTLVAYVLQDNYNKFSPEQKIVCDSIIARSIKASAHFKNRNRNTYNFWRTDTATRFNYSWWLPVFKGNSSLPDDMDDTVLGLLMNDAGKDSAEALHRFMQSYINSNPPLKTTYKIYAHDSAYSTWFGKKMPVVFDVSVMCNVLSFVQRHNLNWTKADSAGLKHIVKTIQRNDIEKHPVFISPYYGNTSVILYHLARLMSIKPIGELENLKLGLKEIAQERLASSGNILEKIMLSIALIKWGADPGEINIGINDLNGIERNSLPFFIGNIPSYFKQPCKGKFIGLRLLMYYHYCPAWNDCLLLEYLLLK